MAIKMILILQCGFQWMIALCMRSYQKRIIFVKILWCIAAVKLDRYDSEVSSGFESWLYHQLL